MNGLESRGRVLMVCPSNSPCTSLGIGSEYQNQGGLCAVTQRMIPVNDLSAVISQFGFPIVAAVGLGYFIYYIWVWATNTVQPVLDSAMGSLVALIDRVRMLDNDMIRLNQKLQIALEYKSKLSQDQQQELDDIVTRYGSRSQQFDSSGKTPPEKKQPRA